MGRPERGVRFTYEQQSRQWQPTISGATYDIALPIRSSTKREHEKGTGGIKHPLAMGQPYSACLPVDGCGDHRPLPIRSDRPMTRGLALTGVGSEKPVNASPSTTSPMA